MSKLKQKSTWIGILTAALGVFDLVAHKQVTPTNSGAILGGLTAIWGDDPTKQQTAE